MLGISFNICRGSSSTYKFIFFCLVSINACCINCADNLLLPSNSVAHEWVSRYLNSLDENATIEEMVDFLFVLSANLKTKGYDMPSLAELSVNIRNYLQNENIPIDDEDFNLLLNEIKYREQSESCLINLIDSYNASNFCFHKIKKSKSKESSKVSSKMTFGIVKCLGGSLLCLIPFPAAQAVGAGLVLNGINDCIDDARDQGDCNERMQKLDQIKRQEDLQI